MKSLFVSLCFKTFEPFVTYKIIHNQKCCIRLACSFYVMI